MKVIHWFYLGCLLCLSPAYAHQLSTAYLKIKQIEEQAVSGELQIDLSDLAGEIWLDTNDDREVTWSELSGLKPEILTWVDTHLSLKSESSTCQMTPDNSLALDDHFNSIYLVINWAYECQNNEQVRLRYSGFFETNNNHKLIITWPSDNDTTSRIIDSKDDEIDLGQSPKNSTQTFTEYLKQGVIHILIGYDHIIFIFALLLAVLIHKGRSSNKQIMWEIIQLVTTFTVAHSLTLILTSFGLLSFSTKWVEVIIAATVAFTAFNNLIPVVKRVMPLTFIFGLFHGMGFASVLGELGVPDESKWLPVLSFNVGVELGQIGLVMIMLPLLIAVSSRTKNATLMYRYCSAAVMALALIWIYQRL